MTDEKIQKMLLIFEQLKLKNEYLKKLKDTKEKISCVLVRNSITSTDNLLIPREAKTIFLIGLDVEISNVYSQIEILIKESIINENSINSENKPNRNADQNTTEFIFHSE